MDAWDKRTKRIYRALGDDLSRSIFKRRLLFSLTGDGNEIWQMVCESFPNAWKMREKKVLFLRRRGWGRMAASLHEAGHFCD